MRLSDLMGKEVINLEDGARLGFVDECDLLLDGPSGRISAMLMPKKGLLTALMGEGRSHTIPWQSIRRIGDEVIIVDLTNAYERAYPLFRRGEEG